jgi:hypothetical protein
MALLLAAKESIWIQRFLAAPNSATRRSTATSSTATIKALSLLPTIGNIKHDIDIQYHFIREGVQDGKIDLRYCLTEDMLADGMTKALARDN